VDREDLNPLSQRREEVMQLDQLFDQDNRGVLVQKALFLGKE
jgi:hypothetical protein